MPKVQRHEANSPTSIEHSEETILCHCELLSFGINQAAAYLRGESGLYIFISDIFSAGEERVQKP